MFITILICECLDLQKITLETPELAPVFILNFLNPKQKCNQLRIDGFTT
jgi:hypothetical protein